MRLEKPIDENDLKCDYEYPPPVCSYEGRFYTGKSVLKSKSPGDGKFEVAIFETTYKGGIQNGPYRQIHKNGQVLVKGAYKNGTEDGVWVYRDKDGNKYREVKWENTKQIYNTEFK